jgi:hypothetical protein
LLRAVPARRLEVARFGVEQRDEGETGNLRQLEQFAKDPQRFVAAALETGDDSDMTI